MREKTITILFFVLGLITGQIIWRLWLAHIVF